MKFFIAFACLAAVAFAAEVEVLRQTADVGAEAFEYAYELSDGSSASVHGDANQHVGSYKYVSPDGTPVEITYVADENGYQPSGSVLPVGPEIPAAIIRSLEYIRTHPSKEDSRRR